jgi:hypothetical protein
MDLLSDKDSFTLQADDWSPSRLFRAGGEGMKSLVGALLKVPELNFPTIGAGDGKSIASMLEMWVSGKTLREIAELNFGDEPNLQKRLTECCRTLYQTLTHQGSWGIGALQSMAGLADAELTNDAKAEIRSVPSMIYYGVSTVEAVLMRSLGVPRSVSVPLGRRFQEETDKNDATPRLQKARKWLAESSAEVWQQVARESSLTMDGKRMRAAWRIITGDQFSE